MKIVVRSFQRLQLGYLIIVFDSKKYHYIYIYLFESKIMLLYLVCIISMKLIYGTN